MKIIQQDMLEIQSGVLFHQVNCIGVMGGGIAYALAKKFPGLEKAYKEFCDDNIEFDTSSLLGKVFVFKVNDDLFIANIFGQDNVSTGSRQTSYDATVMAFELIQDSAYADMTLYFPYKMGCGLGGGNWNIYSAIIEEHFPNAIICKQ